MMADLSKDELLASYILAHLYCDAGDGDDVRKVKVLKPGMSSERICDERGCEYWSANAYRPITQSELDLVVSHNHCVSVSCATSSGIDMDWRTCKGDSLFDDKVAHLGWSFTLKPGFTIRQLLRVLREMPSKLMQIHGIIEEHPPPFGLPIRERNFVVHTAL